jgi:imidazolonepropionase-like amidohydrolase
MRFLWLFCVTSLCAQDVLIRNAMIHAVTGPQMSGSVLIRGGMITEAGARVTAPKGAAIIDAKGAHLYPGLIDSATLIGLTEISSIRETQDAVEIGDLNPQLRTLIAINPASEHIPVARGGGITTVITEPAGGVIGGQSALIHLDGWTWEEMEVLRSAALHLRFPTRRDGGSRRGGAASSAESGRDRYEQQLRKLTALFEESRRYQKAKAAGGRSFRTDLKYEAMIPVLERKLPVAIVAERERAIRDALAFAERENIRVVLNEVREPGGMLADLARKKIPVILPTTHSLPIEEDSAYDEQFTLPARLHQAGVPFAFGSFNSANVRNLPFQAATAVAFGLPYDEALKALTINAARIWGVDDRIGSIEIGKWADLILTSGDPLETTTQVHKMFIKGKEVSLESKHTRLYERYLNRP